MAVADNAVCPDCQTRFLIVPDAAVECPSCKSEQKLPIVYVGEGRYFCFVDQVEFGVSSLDKPSCHVCRAKFELLRALQ